MAASFAFRCKKGTGDDGLVIDPCGSDSFRDKILLLTFSVFLIIFHPQEVGLGMSKTYPLEPLTGDPTSKWWCNSGIK